MVYSDAFAVTVLEGGEVSQVLKHGQCLHIEGRRRASHSDPAQAGKRGKHRARMQNSRGLGLAEAQVTD